MNQILGKIGEDMATDFLLKKGYEIVERNYRFGRNEVDIIAFNDEEIVFVEVKTRNNNQICEPHKSVTKQKQKQIIKVANHYLQENEVENNARLDVISIIFNERIKEIEHIEAAFSP